MIALAAVDRFLPDLNQHRGLARPRERRERASRRVGHFGKRSGPTSSPGRFLAALKATGLSTSGGLPLCAGASPPRRAGAALTIGARCRRPGTGAGMMHASNYRSPRAISTALRPKGAAVRFVSILDRRGGQGEPRSCCGGAERRGGSTRSLTRRWNGRYVVGGLSPLAQKGRPMGAPKLCRHSRSEE